MAAPLPPSPAFRTNIKTVMSITHLAPLCPQIVIFCHSEERKKNSAHTQTRANSTDTEWEESTWIIKKRRKFVYVSRKKYQYLVIYFFYFFLPSHIHTYAIIPLPPLPHPSLAPPFLCSKWTYRQFARFSLKNVWIGCGANVSIWTRNQTASVIVSPRCDTAVMAAARPSTEIRQQNDGVLARQTIDFYYLLKETQVLKFYLFCCCWIKLALVSLIFCRSPFFAALLFFLAVTYLVCFLRFFYFGKLLNF